METKKVCIVGAGIAGMLACKYTLSKGYQPIVFESLDTVGGVWVKTMGSTKLQSPKSLYQFSDYPWPNSVEQTLPNRDQVLEYIHSYAKHFNLLKHVRLNTKVMSINYDGPLSHEEIQSSRALWGGVIGDDHEVLAKEGKWLVTVQELHSHSIEVMQVDFVILCVGRFSEVPNIPKFPVGEGPDACEAKVMHSVEYSALDYKRAKSLIKGKQVTVVGYGKTALDIPMECSTANGVDKPCTIVCRTPHWNIPETYLSTFPLKYMYLNRFAELWVRKPGDGLFLFLLALILWPLRWAICKAVETKLKRMHRLEKYGVLPERNFLKEMNSCSISTIPKGFYENVEEGCINVKRCSKFSLGGKGVTLHNSASNVTEFVKSDLVILATGFNGEQKVKDIFASSKFQAYIMGSRSTLKPLYRECIHPRIPQLAVIGFNDSLSSLYSSEMKCRWLAELLDGKFKLPSIKDMEEDISKWDKLIKSYSEDPNKRTCVGSLHIWHNDLLCKDMGWTPKRKKEFWAELFEPYGPMDYVQPNVSKTQTRSTLDFGGKMITESKLAQ